MEVVMAIIIAQTTVFGYGQIEALGDLERIQMVRALWNSLIAMRVIGHPTVESLRRELSRNSQLRKMLGFDDFGRRGQLVPPARVFSGFLRSLESERASLDAMFAQTVETLQGMLPGYGVNLAGDGKFLDSHAKREGKGASKNPGRRGEHDETYSTKSYVYTGADGKRHEKKETHFGFKAHIICDVATELPVAFSVTPANQDERSEMMDLLKGMTPEQIERAETLALDRGYDSTQLIKDIKGHGIAPIVDIRNCWKDGEKTRQYKDTDIVYNYRGEVFFCELDHGEAKYVKMVYEGYDRAKKCLRYLHQRTAVERLNGRIDRDFMFEGRSIRGLAKMRLSVTLTMLAMNSMAIAKVRLGQRECLSAFTKPLMQTAA
jgi:IS5 family transposase